MFGKLAPFYTAIHTFQECSANAPEKNASERRTPSLHVLRTKNKSKKAMLIIFAMNYKGTRLALE